MIDKLTDKEIEKLQAIRDKIVKGQKTVKK
jgi:hypothetical protein